MSFLFGRTRQKTPQELVRSTRDCCSKLDVPLEKRRAAEEVLRNLGLLKQVIQGTAEVEPQPEQIAALATEVYNTDMIPVVIQNLYRLDFDAKKDMCSVFNSLLRYGPQGRLLTVEYIQRRRPDTLVMLLQGYDNPQIAVTCGGMLRECIKHEALADIVIHDERFWNFFEYVQGGSFDISSDAFSTFKDLLTRHKGLVANFLAETYSAFFAKYNTLLVSMNYVAQRQSVKLLGEILLDRANYNIMTAYVDSPEHLKLIMNLLRDKSRNVQYEAFHVFKVFVANPKKSRAVEDILIKNRERLLVFLPKFHADRKDDEQFFDEKAFLTKQIEALQPRR
ncbi:Mo25-like protein [Ascobolus immersus RN42]|uniref:Mo25-like protein n=1 Tax=Ascobolus immersus RN42 TaxID=1160509 RepID=A0A3N4IID8_ASCIM|nr:Mo25-like protein [Ascobolus immersus RN42]